MGCQLAVKLIISRITTVKFTLENMMVLLTLMFNDIKDPNAGIFVKIHEL